MPANDYIYIKLFNFIILIAKWFNNNKKNQKNKPLYVLQVIVLLNIKIVSIVLTNTLYISRGTTWQTLIYELVKLEHKTNMWFMGVECASMNHQSKRIPV